MISQLAHTAPVAITVNGKEDIVVLGHENFVDMCNQIETFRQREYFYEMLEQSEDDIAGGRTIDGIEFFDKFLNDLKNE